MARLIFVFNCYTPTGRSLVSAGDRVVMKPCYERFGVLLVALIATHKSFGQHDCRREARSVDREVSTQCLMELDDQDAADLPCVIDHAAKSRKKTFEWRRAMRKG